MVSVIGSDTRFAFTVEGGTIKYVVLGIAEYLKWDEGQLSPKWIEASSDSRIIVAWPTHYLFYNEDPHPKTLCIESFKSVNETNYFYMDGGFLLLALGTGTLMSGLYKRLPASMNPRLAFAIFCGFYFIVLLASYLFILLYPFYDPSYPLYVPYSWFLVPLVATFFMGYLIEEVHTAVKIIIIYFFLHTCILIGLLYTFWLPDVYLIITVCSVYWIIDVPVNITISLAGIVVREGGSDIVAACRTFIRPLLESSIEIKFLFVMSILLSMGMFSTGVSSYFYRVAGETLLTVLGDPVNMIYCGFPLPYLHLTTASHISVVHLGIRTTASNSANFFIDTLFYTSIYSIITALGYAIARSRRQRIK